MTAKKNQHGEIIKTATKLFAEKGFENVSTRDIAKAAQINNASLYYYFSNKEALLYEILDDTMSEGLRLLTEIEKTEKDTRERLKKILLVHTRAALDYNKMKLLVHNQESLTDEHRQALNAKQKNYIGMLIKTLDELKKKKELADINTTFSAFAFFGMVSWAYRWFNPEGKIKTEELSEIFYHIFTRGVFPEKTGTGRPAKKRSTARPG